MHTPDSDAPRASLHPYAVTVPLVVLSSGSPEIVRLEIATFDTLAAAEAYRSMMLGAEVVER